MASSSTATKGTNKRLVWITAFFAVLAAVFFIVMIVYVVKYNKLLHEQNNTIKGSKHDDESNAAQHEPDSSPAKASLKSNKVYTDFTPDQYAAIINYMKERSGLGVVSSVRANLNSNYIYSIDQILPDKQEVLQFLDNDDIEPPMVKAKVTLFMGASNPKTIKEVTVYPVDAPNMMDEFVNPGNKTPSWQSRPVCNLVEARAINDFLLKTLKPLTPMLKAHLNMWYDDTCTEITCLFYAPVPRVVPGHTDRNIFIFFHLGVEQEDYYLWPAPLNLIIYTPGNGDVHTVRAVKYDNVEYSSIQELVDAYNRGSVPERTPGIQEKFTGSYGSPKRRGVDVNPDNLSSPTQTSPAKRFLVNDRHVSWLGWEFDFVFGTISSVQLFNLKFNNERIAYQLGLQDILVMYTGTDTDKAFRSYMDVGWTLGARTTALRRGYDCPESAEYITGSVYDVGFDRPIKLKDAACVFEYRNHVPLRRHYSTDFFNPEKFRFTTSMLDVVLVFRQILTVWNYDYIMDVEIHQNGVIQANLHPSGYIQVIPTDRSEGIRFGYDILPEAGITALLHNHIFDFVVDLDIGDPNSNRFKIIDIESESKPHPYNTAKNMSYMTMKETTKVTEQDSIVHYDFTKPRQYIVYNNDEKNARNNQTRGYRIQSGSFVYPVIPSDDALFKAASWVGHQIAVTKYKDTETSTLSYFSQGDPYDPLISLSYFQEDNESIIDSDLVCWVTIGVNHIPTAEDIPVTTTASKTMSFYLIPHNYYEEDPSIASRDAQVEYPAV